MMQENCIHFQMKNAIAIKHLDTVQLTDNMYLRIAKQHFFFALNDFVRFHIDSIECIDDLFVVRISTIASFRLFFKLMIIQEKHVSNSILNISVFELSEFDCVVDFFNIDSARSYLISVISSDSNCALQLQ
jgi:hypothetical protein